VGGVERGEKRGRGTSKPIVVIAIEVKEHKGFGRVRIRHVPDASGANLQPFICDVVAQEVTVRAYGRLDRVQWLIQARLLARESGAFVVG